MNYYKITIFSLGIILCSCGTQRAINHGDTTADNEVTPTRSTPILYSETVPDREQLKFKQVVVEKKSEPKIEKSVAKTASQTPSITFTAVETANIRVPGNNPLPSNGVLELDLSELQKDFCYPYKGKVISNYGMRGRSMHSGVDIKAVPGDTIRAVMSGVVRMSKTYSGYGNVIVIRHACGIETVYSHQLKNLVRPNEVVNSGQAIGLAGRTGRATTEHVHFELRAASEHIDPSKFLDYDNMSLREGSLIIKNRGGKLVAYHSASGVDSVPMVALEPSTKSGEASAKVNTTEPRASSSATTAASSAASASAKTTYHTVKRGDTLSAIARMYSTNVATLCKFNNIDKDGVLSLGQRIKVPTGTRD